MPNLVLTTSKPYCFTLAGVCLNISVARVHTTSYGNPTPWQKALGDKAFSPVELNKPPCDAVLVTESASLTPAPVTLVSHRTRHVPFPCSSPSEI